MATLQNFSNGALPAIGAPWLNLVDGLLTTVFEQAQTNPAARAALCSDLPLEIVNGGTSSRTAAGALAALGALTATTVVPVIDETVTQGFIGSVFYPRTAPEIAAGITPSNTVYPPGSFYRYGAKGGAKRISDVTVVGGTLTSPSGGFAGAQVGMVCVVLDAGAARAGGRPAPLITTISSVVSAYSVTVAVAPTMQSTVTLTGTLNATTAVTGLSSNPITLGVGLIRLWTVTGTYIPANTTLVGVSSTGLTLSAAATGSGSEALTLTAPLEVCFGYDDSIAINEAASLPYTTPPALDNFLMTQPLTLGGSGCNNFFMPPGSLLIIAQSTNTTPAVSISGFDRYTQPYNSTTNGMRYTPFEVDIGELECCNTGLDGLSIGPSNFSKVRVRIVNPFRSALCEWFTTNDSWQESNIIDVNCAMVGLHFHHKVNAGNVYQNLGSYRIQGRACGLNSVYLGINASTQAAQCGGAIRVYAGGNSTISDAGISQNQWGSFGSCEFDAERTLALSYGSDVCNSPITFADASQSYVIEGAAPAHYSNLYTANYLGSIATEDITQTADTRGGYIYYAMPGIIIQGTTLISPAYGPWGETSFNSAVWNQSNYDNFIRFQGVLFYESGQAQFQKLGLNGNSPASQQTGWGTPTGTSVISNYPGASATLVQTSEALAAIISQLKSIGILGT